MTLSDLEHFRNLLHGRQQNLLEWLDSPVAASDNDIHKAQKLLSEIRDALKHVESHDYGTCVVCKEEIERDRLEIQPTAKICLDCISREERSRLEEELFLASKIHRALLPQSAAKIDGFEIAVRSLAASMVGGDYFDFLTPQNGGSTRIIVADTMGKGLPAGLLMSNIQGALRILSEDIQSPRKLVSRLNQWLVHNVPMTKFISLICAAVEDGQEPVRLVYANAGHCPGIMVRRDGIVERLDPTGGVLGVHEGFTYEEKRLEIYPGDLLLLYTDGVAEARNSTDEEYGDERLIAYASAHAGEPLKDFIEGLIQEVRGFTGFPEFEDDLTLLALRRAHTPS